MMLHRAIVAAGRSIVRFRVGTFSSAAAETARTSENLSEIQDEFTRQAAGFEANWTERSNQSTEQLMSKVMDKVQRQSGPISPQTRALDVASGTGIFARTLLPFCRHVTGLDATEAMLEHARKNTAKFLGSNDDPASALEDRASFLVGDAGNMPFEDGTFDVVATRLAIHHFPHPHEQVQEMARVVRPGGRVVIVDIVSPSNDTEASKLLNHLETLRDPTHTESKTVEGLQQLLADAGLDVVDCSSLDPDAMATLDNEMDLDAWMTATKTPAAHRAEITAAVEAHLAGNGPNTGMYPQRAPDGKVTFLHKYAVVQGVRH